MSEKLLDINMTSNISAGFEVSCNVATLTNDNTLPYYLFNKDIFLIPQTYPVFHTASGSYSTKPARVILKCDRAYRFTKIDLYSRQSGFTYNPTKCIVYGSNDGITFNYLVDISIKFTNLAMKDIALNNMNQYRYYAFDFYGDQYIVLHHISLYYHDGAIGTIIETPTNYILITDDMYNTTTKQYTLHDKSVDINTILINGIISSDLYNERTINGETFKPIDKINHLLTQGYKVIKCVLADT